MQDRSNTETQQLVQNPGTALLDKIGPAIIVTHSQAGVANEHVRLEKVGFHGNGHVIPSELNSLEVAAFINKWLEEHVR